MVCGSIHALTTLTTSPDRALLTAIQNGVKVHLSTTSQWHAKMYLSETASDVVMATGSANIDTNSRVDREGLLVWKSTKEEQQSCFNFVNSLDASSLLLDAHLLSQLGIDSPEKLKAFRLWFLSLPASQIPISTEGTIVLDAQYSKSEILRQFLKVSSQTFE